MPPRDEVRIEPWPADGLPLLKRLLGDPAMTEHLGGPESDAKLTDRQLRYERLGGAGGGRMFVVVYGAGRERAGSVGYWEKEWRGGTVWETGWSVLPEFQGRGIAAEATRLAIEAARAEARHGALHAFPSVDNAPSNAICRKLGFTLVEEGLEFEYPPGNVLVCNDWRYDL
jgi:RimJ/RimL family protein N-acetyltransferase